MTKKYSLSMLILSVFLLFSCENGKKAQKTSAELKSISGNEISVPPFNADSAFSFVAAQTAFGPRVPNTAAHQKCALYLQNKLRGYADTVMVQEFQMRAFDGTILNGKNIIASFNPKNEKRIFLSAHWDSRPFADHDPDAANHKTPIDGANDGASGVGILIELARLLQIQKAEMGVDIILFDLEDYGTPEFAPRTANSENTWALGSQYWSLNPHYPNYNAQYGILLDMVGAKNAVFRMEYFSMLYAPQIVKDVWKTAATLGFSDYFLLENGSSVLDDHYFINRNSQIPTIDIIQHDSKMASGFYEHWHTLNDNLQNIDKETLNAVGLVVTQVVYQER
ncbi:MAG TPA: glutamine cyclotransferase [Bacteroidales bacterium]|nr:glutamine cyclotransferase [Bacteroidales bacterium]